MAFTIEQAHAVNRLLDFWLGRCNDYPVAAPTSDEAKHAAMTLAKYSGKALGAGWHEEDVERLWNTAEVVFKQFPDGGFVAGNRQTGLTSYAYATSELSARARKDPARTAREMLAQENGMLRVFSETVREYDRRNWALLDEEVSGAS